MTRGEKLQGQPIKYTFCLLGPWPEWDIEGRVGPLFSTGTRAGVGQPVWGEGGLGHISLHPSDFSDCC